MIVDTDILIWYMRGNITAKRALDRLGTFILSAVSYMEILQGMRNNSELYELKSFIRKRNLRLIYLDSEITTKAVFFMERFSLSHGLRMGDALIAATADVWGETLLTANVSHYRVIPNLPIKRFRPA